jgi:hypothetical protein
MCAFIFIYGARIKFVARQKQTHSTSVFATNGMIKKRGEVDARVKNAKERVVVNVDIVPCRGAFATEGVLICDVVSKN